MAAFACSAPAGFLRVQRAPANASRKPRAQRVVRARVQASAANPSPELHMPCRRQALALLGFAALSGAAPAAFADEEKVLCDAACVQGLDKLEMVTLPSGLKYRDIVVGTGPSPEPGFQVVVDYVAMTPEGRIFENSVDKGKPFDIRVVSGDADSPASTIAGLNEGLKTMRSGGVRRLYVPGALGFPKGLPSGPGRPRLPPNSDTIFDVKLLYIPGLE